MHFFAFIFLRCPGCPPGLAMKGNAKQKKTNPKPQRRQRNRRAPRARPARSLVSFDPLSRLPAPTLLPTGSYTPVSGIARGGGSSSATVSYLYAFTCIGSSSAVMMKSSDDASPIHVAGWVVGLNGSHTSGSGPTSGRGLKYAVTMRNIASPLGVGGAVTVLRTSSRLIVDGVETNLNGLTQAQMQELMTDIRTHPSSRLYSGSEFVKSKRFVLLPKDPISAAQFRPWTGDNGLLGNSGVQKEDYFGAHVYGCQPDAAITDGPLLMSPWENLYVLIDATATTNDYKFQVDAEYATRWPIGHVLGKDTVDPKITDAKEYDKALQPFHGMVHKLEVDGPSSIA